MVKWCGEGEEILGRDNLRGLVKMSIKELVESVTNLLNELKTLISDILKSIKDFCSWLYNKEWSKEEIGILIAFFILAVAIVKLEDLMKKKKKKDLGKKKDKTKEDSHNKRGFKRLRNVEEGVRGKKE